MKNSHKKFPEEDWEKGNLGKSATHVRKVSKKREKKVDEALGLQMISIRLQKSLIDKLKKMAKETGIGYQTYIRQLLTMHVAGKLRSGTYDR